MTHWYSVTELMLKLSIHTLSSKIDSKGSACLQIDSALPAENLLL